MTPARLETVLASSGLQVLGQLNADQGVSLPDLLPGKPAGALVLVGHVGSGLWPVFSASPEYLDGRPDSLDRWSRRIGDSLALESGGRALYPFDGPPFHPFQRWAMRARPLHRSPLGILIDSEFGLWHAWRFALALPGALAPAPLPDVESPCVDCSAKPCVSACPAGATRESGFAHEHCIRHLQSASGESCRADGCLSRAACPVAQHLRYVPRHGRFHMLAFVSGLDRFHGK
jgi:hypothetical protein